MVITKKIKKFISWRRSPDRRTSGNILAQRTWRSALRGLILTMLIQAAILDFHGYRVIFITYGNNHENKIPSSEKIWLALLTPQRLPRPALAGGGVRPGDIPHPKSCCREAAIIFPSCQSMFLHFSDSQKKSIENCIFCKIFRIFWENQQAKAVIICSGWTLACPSPPLAATPNL